MTLALERHLTDALLADAERALSRAQRALQIEVAKQGDDGLTASQRIMRRELRNAYGKWAGDLHQDLQWDLMSQLRSYDEVSGMIGARNISPEHAMEVESLIRSWVQGVEQPEKEAWTAWNDSYLDGYNAGGDWAARLLSAGSVTDFRLRDPNILDAIGMRVEQRVEHLGPQLADATTKWLYRGMWEEGNSPRDMRSAIRGQGFEEIVGWRIDRIARTEALMAVEQGKHDTAVRSGVEFVEWAAFIDDRTRDSHIRLDGEQIKITDRFSNGLRYPGDPSGPLEEVVNCRCSTLPVPPDRLDPDRVWRGFDEPAGGSAETRLYEQTVRHGGATYDPQTGQLHEGSGFAVAEVDGTYRTISPDDPESFAQAMRDLRDEFPDAHVGTWHDAASDQIHIDPSRVFLDQSEAEAEARARNQLAMYDLGENREIRF